MTKSEQKIPKKRGRKPKKKMYFGMEVQEAIIEYNNNPEDYTLRNKLYSSIIHPAFDKLCENIINTFKFTYFDDCFDDIKHEVTTFLVMNMHKYDGSKGSKAFSYFSVVAKNYLILHNNANYKKYKTHDNMETVGRYLETNNPESEEFMKLFAVELENYLEENIPFIFKKEKDIKIAYSILELLKVREEIENFNKKALYILIREMTNVNTSEITKIVNVLKKHYRKLLQQFAKTGTLNDNLKQWKNN